MGFLARPKLTVPAVLAASALTLGCPPDDTTDTGNDTGANTTAPTGGTTAPTSETAGTAAMTSSTGLDTGSTSGVVPDCEGLDETTCMADPSCIWEGTEIGCLINCGVIEDQTTCESIDYCEWFEDACYGTI